MVSLNTKPNLDHLLTITHHSSHIGTYPPCVRSYTKLWANESFFSIEFYLDETSEDVPNGSGTRLFLACSSTTITTRVIRYR